MISKFVTFFWLVGFVVVYRPIHAQYDYVNWSNMKMESNKILVGKVYEKLSVRSRMECFRFCVKTECKSFNYDHVHKMCELNNATKHESSLEDFQENADYVYVDGHDDDVCTNRECCLDSSTVKNKDKYCYTQIDIENYESTSSSVYVRVYLTAGMADKVSVDCSEGEPSVFNETVDFSNDVVVSCDELPPGGYLTVTVSASYLDIPAATASLTIKSRTSPVIFEEHFTNTTAVVAVWSLPPGETADDFVAECSNGSLIMLSQNASHGSAMCNQVEPGTKVGLTVNAQTNSVDGEPAHIIMISNPDQVEFTSQNSSFLSVFVKWEIMSGSVSAFNVSCSVGEPASIVVNTLDGSGSVKCSDVGPGVQVVVNVAAVHYSKQGIPSSMVLSTSKLVNVTLVEDTTGTNTSTVVAKMTSDTTQSVSYNVECSEGNPSPSGMMEANMTKDVFCDGLEAGNTVNLSVRFVHGTGNLSVGFASISISTTPDIVLFEMTDLSQFEFLLNNNFSFGVATWNLTSGTADLFQISCSDGLPFPDVIQINDSHIGMCEMSESLAETVEITVTPELNGKAGHPATIVVPVVGNRRDAGSDYPSSADEMTTDNSLNETTSSGLTNSSGSTISPDISNSSGQTTSTGLTTLPYNLMNVTLVENNATNTTSVVAKLSSDATQIVSYTVTCSKGTPSTSGTMQPNMTKIVSCFGLEAGTNVDLSVQLNYNNTPVASAAISISTIPAMVVLFEMTDLSQFELLLNESIPFGVATWNLTSGTADLFRISCSDGTAWPGVIYINDPHIGMCEMSESLAETVEITVTTELNGKTGDPATVDVTVVRNDRSGDYSFKWSAD